MVPSSRRSATIAPEPIMTTSASTHFGHDRPIPDTNQSMNSWPARRPSSDKIVYAVGPLGRGMTVSNRVELAHEPDFALGRLTVSPSRREVVRDDGEREVIEHRVMQVLIALSKADGSIVTRDELIMLCWDGRVVGEDSIHRVISRLRKLATGIGAGSIEIETITKIGYRLISDGPATSGGGLQTPEHASPGEREAGGPKSPRAIGRRRSCRSRNHRRRWRLSLPSVNSPVSAAGGPNSSLTSATTARTGDARVAKPGNWSLQASGGDRALLCRWLGNAGMRICDSLPLSRAGGESSPYAPAPNQPDGARWSLTPAMAMGSWR